MLKQRIITALVLLAILLPSVLFPAPEAFGAIAVILISAGAWEWAKLNQCNPLTSLVISALCAGLCIASWATGLVYFPLRLLWLIAGSAWVVLGAWLLYVGVKGWSAVPRVLRLVGGVFALWVAWLAVVQARIMGINFLFSVLVLVWIADIFAYFSGRLFGGRFFKRKLAPTISPGKTWEGVCGGMIGVVICALLWRSLDHVDLQGQSSIYTRLGDIGIPFLLLAVVFMAMMSVVGDLVESLFKRSAGVKDSSALLPGHGGVLDRVDALLPILPLAMMLVTL
jgi:phosphatidate cytidylyltransferase